jgi:hypothetical protein
VILADVVLDARRAHALGERHGARAHGLASRGRGEERARFEATLFAPGPCHVATLAETRVSFAGRRCAEPS